MSGRHGEQMSPSEAITATCSLATTADVEQATGWVREALGPIADVTVHGPGVLLARCGSRATYRLWGALTTADSLPMRARFDITAEPEGTRVAVSMVSDQGWYLLSTAGVSRDYRVRFDLLARDLQRAGLSLGEPVDHGQRGAAGSLAP